MINRQIFVIWMFTAAAFVSECYLILNPPQCNFVENCGELLLKIFIFSIPLTFCICSTLSIICTDEEIENECNEYNNEQPPIIKNEKNEKNIKDIKISSIVVPTNNMIGYQAGYINTNQNTAGYYIVSS